MGVIMILAKRGIYFLLVFICRCYGDLKEKSVFGVVTSESVIVAASSALSGGDMKLRGNHDGIVVLGQPSCYSSFNNEGGDVLVGLRGEHSDCDIIIADLEAVCDQHLESYDTSLSCDSIVQYYRKIIYEALSKLHQYNTDALVGGYSPLKQRSTLCRIDAVGGAQDFYYAAHGPETQLILSYFDYKYGARNSIGSDPDCFEIGSLLGSMGENVLIDHDNSLEILRTCWDVIRAREKTDSGALLIKAVDSRGKLK